MKKTMLFWAALCAVAVSCSKESSQSGETLPAGIYYARMSAHIASEIEAKVALDDKTLGLSWQDGDDVKVYQDYDDGGLLSKLNYQGGGGQFSGTVTLQGGDAGVYFMSRNYRVKGKTGKCDLSLESTRNQTGLLSDLGNYLLLYNSEPITPVYDGSNVTLNGSVDKCMNPIIKVNIPESLNIISVNLYASAPDADGVDTDVPVAGAFTFRQSSNSMLSDGSRTDILVARNDDSQISGDTYIAMLNAPKTTGVQDNNIGRATKIRIKVRNSNKRYFTYTKNVKDLEGGKIYNLGTLPVTCVDPVITADEKGLVTIKSSPAEARIYYTTDGTTPSSSSSPQYVDPFYVSGSCTVKAMSIATDLGHSAVVSKEIIFESVTAPVLSITTTGKLTASCATEGATLTYSYSALPMPEDPDTAIPADGIDLSNGTYYIRVRATKGNIYAETNACLRHYQKAMEEDSKTIASYSTEGLGTGDFTVYNPTDASVELHKSSAAWFLKKASYPGCTDLRFGCDTKYTASASLYVSLKSGKGMNFHYGDTDTKLSKVDIANEGDYAKYHTQDVVPGKNISFDFANTDSIVIYGCAWLEQGFDVSYEPADASAGNEGFTGRTDFAY